MAKLFPTVFGSARLIVWIGVGNIVPSLLLWLVAFVTGLGVVGSGGGVAAGLALG